MSLSSIQTYINGVFSHVPVRHWVGIGVIVVAVVVGMILRWRRMLGVPVASGADGHQAAQGRQEQAGQPKKVPVYGAIALGLAVLVALVFLDSAVVSRFFGHVPHGFGIHLHVDFSRFFDTREGRYEFMANIAILLPFGFFLAEYLAEVGKVRGFRRIAYAALAAFGLSLCVETLQLVLHVGFFEIIDLITNTTGGLLGATLSTLWRLCASPRP